jgi:tRNA threonylcarbamoyladenosine biosynthesis protein TsaB
MLLALDTSSRWMGIACYDGANVLYENTWYSAHYHTAQLAASVDEALHRLEAKVGDVKAIGVAVGPGGFTGLRIGLALAKGLALSAGMALLGIPSLDALVVQTGDCIQKENQNIDDEMCIAVLQAGRGRFAAGFYRRGNDPSAAGRLVKTNRGCWRHEKDEILTVESLIERCSRLGQEEITASVLICGELSQQDRITLEHELHDAQAGRVYIASPADSLRRSSYLAELAWTRWQAGQCDDPATLIPIYLT